jgi:hypothetical protein
MPLPNPKKEEEKNEFISRCMSDKNIKKDFQNNDQRVAVCYSLFKKAKKNQESSAEISWERSCPKDSFYWY